MWGVAIMFIVLGASQYMFREQLRLRPSLEARQIGFAFWWAGWLMLAWWISTTLLGIPNEVKMTVSALGTIWVGVRGIQVGNRIMQQVNE
ncbi:hypothetical protein [Paenibacillus sp. ISL-20]|uniref:hypothetical protein n=1 Tax=Paenibacillus sp. ISL-20 TaxID=2819163 RepID=UPI001BEC87E3|nr:hypothetical protein [Paenibacillus sp. ISL-20]MBT2765790.1 hypothetical protein [Paenibacillus sp. ISL-20]